MSTQSRLARRARATALLIPTMAMVAACSNDWNSAGGNINGARSDIARMSPALGNIQDSGRPGNVNVDRGMFLADQGFRSGNGNPLPARFETATGVTVNTATPINIEEFSQIIEDLTGIRVDYEDIRIGGPAPNSPAGAETNEDPATAVAQLLARSQGTVVNPVDRTFRVRHTGKLSDVLDRVASRLSADWSYEGGRILFKGPQTMTYTIWALPSETSSTGSVGGGANTFGSGGAAATTTSSLSNNYWGSIEQGIEGLMPEGARFSINRASGTVTVTATQAVHLRVQDFISNENRRLSRQVAVKLDVLAFSQSRSDTVSTSLEGLLENIGDGLGIAAGSVIEHGAGGTISAGVSGNAGNANATITALSRLGRLSVLQSQSVTAMNNTPTPVSITNERAYVSAVTTVQEEGSAPQTTITPGVINSGMNFVVTPRILSSNDVVLNYSLNLSELVDLREFSTNNNSVQLPEMSSRNFMQSVNIKSGDTVVIASTKIQNTDQERVGPFDPSFWGIGGQRGYNIDDTQILVLMTPVVVDGSNTPRARR